MHELDKPVPGDVEKYVDVEVSCVVDRERRH